MDDNDYDIITHYNREEVLQAIAEEKYAEGYAKGLEINTWLQEHGASNLPYCIVDDEDCLFINQADHLVKTDSRNGLTSEVADRIIEILKGAMNKKH